MNDAKARMLTNPFYVLELSPDAARMEIERQGKKLLGMLELGLSGAGEYDTPVGRGARTPDMVRTAMAELHDPKRRLAHELWAQLPADALVELQSPERDEAQRAAGWTGAKKALGWSR